MIYLTNVNGDWWAYDSREPLYMLDTEDLNAVQLAEIVDEHYGLENDKFENVIREFGKPLYLTELI